MTLPLANSGTGVASILVRDKGRHWNNSLDSAEAADQFQNIISRYDRTPAIYIGLCSAASEWPGQICRFST